MGSALDPPCPQVPSPWPWSERGHSRVPSCPNQSCGCSKATQQAPCVLPRTEEPRQSPYSRGSRASKVWDGKLGWAGPWAAPSAGLVPGLLPKLGKVSPSRRYFLALVPSQRVFPQADAFSPCPSRAASLSRLGEGGGRSAAPSSGPLLQPWGSSLGTLPWTAGAGGTAQGGNPRP